MVVTVRLLVGKKCRALPSRVPCRYDHLLHPDTDIQTYIRTYIIASIPTMAAGKVTAMQLLPIVRTRSRSSSPGSEAEEERERKNQTWDWAGVFNWN